MLRTSRIALLTLCAAAVLFAQDDPPAQTPAPTGGRGGFGGGAAAAVPDPQPYDKVITKEAKTSKGLFTVHQIKERYYYEIPKSELGKDLLWNSQIARTTAGAGYGGAQLANHVIRWELKGNRVLMVAVNYSLTANPDEPIALAVKNANNDAIIQAFPVAAFAKDGAPVIEVTRLFTGDLQEFSARQRIGATGVDATRTFIEHINAFPENLETEVTVTYTRTAGGARSRRRRTWRRWSRRRLHARQQRYRRAAPQHGPPPRKAHDAAPLRRARRLLHHQHHGLFAQRIQGRAHPLHRALAPREERSHRRHLRAREAHRLLHRCRDARRSGCPGSRRASRIGTRPSPPPASRTPSSARKRPPPQQDPTWSPEDVRYSVIRWLPSTTENASGPHISDPRTGEILNADIQFYHNVMNLARDWYFVQVGPLDPRAQKLPLPDDLMGRLLEYVVAHEVGHTLGFQHNMKASSMYPFEKIRDKEWVHKMGHTPSIMDYSRFNYVAQPEDGIAVEDLIPRIGPYDTWATMWGYTPIPGAKTPDDEKPTLQQVGEGAGRQTLAPLLHRQLPPAAIPAKRPKPWAMPMPSRPPRLASRTCSASPKCSCPPPPTKRATPTSSSPNSTAACSASGAPR